MTPAWWLSREVRVLRRPATAYLLMSVVAAAFLLTGMSQASAAQQWSVYEQTRAMDARQVEDCRTTQTAAACDELTASLRDEQDRLRAAVQDRFSGAADLHSAPGAAIAALGVMASLPGLLVVAGLAGVHVAGEWSTGAVRQLRRSPHAALALGGWKVVSLWGTLAAFAAVVWLCLWAASPLLRHVYAVPPLPPEADLLPRLAGQAWRAVLTWGCLSLVAVCLGVLLRQALATFCAVVMLGFVSVALTLQGATLAASPAYWLAGLMRFRHAGWMSEHLWPDQFPLADPDPARSPSTELGVVGLVTVGAVALLVTSWRLTRQDWE